MAKSAKRPEIDAVFTMAPPPRASISGMARFIARNTPVRPSSMVCVHTRSSRSPRKFRRRWPLGSAGWPKALLCRMSRPPKAFTVPPIMASMPAGAPASAVMASATPPALVISSATAWARVPSMSATATFAPRSPKPSAVARPMPEPAPETSTTLPSNRITVLPSPRVRSAAEFQRLSEALHPVQRLVEVLAPEVEDELVDAELLVRPDIVRDLLGAARKGPAVGPERGHRGVVDRRLERDRQCRRIAPLGLGQAEELIERRAQLLRAQRHRGVGADRMPA